MKLPKQIQVGGHQYEVMLTDRIDLLEGNRGLHRHRERQLIVCQAGHASSSITAIFYHELLHAIAAVYVQDDLSEEQVEGIAQGLTQVLPQLGLGLVEGEE